MKELYIYIIGIILGLIAYLGSINGVLRYLGVSDDYISQSAFFILVTTVLITDRLAHFVREDTLRKQSDKHREYLESQFEWLPRLLVGRNDIVTFIDATEGHEYCISACMLAISVRNTVLRYGKTAMVDTDFYHSWIETKRKSIKDNNCSGKEIISLHISDCNYMEDFKKLGRRDYEYRCLDDKTHPMIQMVIFELKNGQKEVVFGWEFFNKTHGPCFLSHNEHLISYFENYFDYYFNNVCHENTRK